MMYWKKKETLRLTLRLFSPSSILCRFLFSVKTNTQLYQHSLQTTCSCTTVTAVCVTASDQLLPLVNQVRGHFIITHELLEAQKVETASAQTEE